MNETIKEGQIWRKFGPFDWLRVNNIQDPVNPAYDGGAIGCGVTLFPPQLKGMQLRGGVHRFIAGTDWRGQITATRYQLLGAGKRGDSAWDTPIDEVI